MPAASARPIAAPERSGGRDKRKLAWLGAVVAAIGLSALAYRALREPRAPSLHWQLAVVSSGPIAAKVTATGALSALVTVSVGSQVSGRIATLGADFGSHVRAGQVVATLEPSLLRAAVKQARANLASAQAAIQRYKAQLANLARTYDRTTTLAERKLVSPADLDAAEANLRMGRAEVNQSQASAAQARAALDQAELNLRYTTVVSPIDGVVISRNVDVGQTVAAALQAPTLFTIAQDLRRMHVDTNVPEADVGKVREGMPVSFTVDAYPGRAFPGRVRQVRDNAQTLQNVVTYDAVVDVDNSERLLKPGMTASVTFVYARRENAVRVSNAALRFKPDPSALAAWRRAAPAAKPSEHIVWVLRDGRAEPVRVRTGISDGSFTELLGGDLAPGDKLITEVSADAGRAKS